MSSAGTARAAPSSSRRPQNVPVIGGVGGAPTLGIYGPTATTGIPGSSRDPRPLRDRTFQATMAEEVLEYLKSQQFERISREPVDMKMLRQPMQKQFVQMFQFIYHQLDPSHQFTKSIDVEVHMLLRNLQYPYLDGITKSQLAAVGGQNWPAILGMLYWLIQQLKTVEECDRLMQEALSADKGTIDVIQDEYAAKAYRAHAMGETDFSDLDKEAFKGYETYAGEMYETLERAKAEMDRLDKEIAKYEAEKQEVATLEDKLKAFEEDIQKCVDYLSHTAPAKEKYQKAIQVTNGFIEEVESQLREADEEKERLVSQVAAVGLSLEDVERMHYDFASREGEIRRLEAEIDELRSTVRSRHEILQTLLQQTWTAVNGHNKSLRDLDIQEPLLSELFVELISSPLDFASRIDHSRHGDPSAYIQGNKSLSEIESLIARRRTEAMERAADLRQEALRVKDDLNRIIDLKHEREESNDNLNVRLRDLEYEYEKVHDAGNDQRNVLKSKIEELNRLNRQLDMEGTRAREDAEERQRQLGAELKAEKSAYEQMRNELNNEIRAMLDFLVNFKMDVQQSLADYRFEQDHELQEIHNAAS